MLHLSNNVVLRTNQGKRLRVLYRFAIYNPRAKLFRHYSLLIIHYQKLQGKCPAIFDLSLFSVSFIVYSERREGRFCECSSVTDATATGFFSSSLFSFLQATTDAVTRITTIAAVIRTTTAVAAVTD